MEILAVYDNGGKTLDRYTVYYDSESNGLYDCRGMSENPTSPNGIGCFTQGMLGNHNGKEINFSDLPIICQNLIKRDLEETNDHVL